MVINLSACIVALADTGSADTGYFINLDEYDYNDKVEEIDNTDISDDTNISAANFIGGVGTSFIPFASIINLAFLGLDSISFIFISIIISIIGALQLLLLVLIGLCFVPNVFGSGVDV